MSRAERAEALLNDFLSENHGGLFYGHSRDPG